MSVRHLISATRQRAVLAELDKRERVLAAQVQAVAQGYVNAAFVFGPGGLGKTHVITSVLTTMVGATWQHHTAGTTPKGLMLALAEGPEAIHLFEDCEFIYKNEFSSSILRAACGSPKQRERWVNYKTAHEDLRINFRGGIIIVSNDDLARGKGPLAAIASRFRPVKWDLSAEERLVRILQMSEEGWRRGGITISPVECLEVAEFLIKETFEGEVKTPVDLRTFAEHALPAFAQWRNNPGSVHWHEMVRAKLQGQVQTFEKREERGNRLEAIALSLSIDKSLTGAQKLEKWKEQTGLGQAIYYRHLKRAKAQV